MILLQNYAGSKQKSYEIMTVKMLTTLDKVKPNTGSIRGLKLGSGQAYMVWQKSNDTDFLLTMNFVLFTNQGYPLQNSSLGQLHSDGGVVSIVHSSGGRLLLLYLSARQLRSSGYYPKYQNGALSSSF